MECVKRLLVADASQEFRCHLVESFQNEPDMEVVAVAGDGATALRLTREYRPDVIVMDITMPDMNGIAMFDQLVRRDLTARLPVIFLTGHGDVPMAVDSLKRGAFDFFEKPFIYKNIILYLSIYNTF